jgi:hypothetical protein
VYVFDLARDELSGADVARLAACLPLELADGKIRSVVRSCRAGTVIAK